jgi:hypothetical protein
VVGVCATSLVDATTYMQVAFESEAFAAAKSPWLNEWLTPPLTKRLGFLEKKDSEQVRREAQHEAVFEAAMEPSRQLHKEGHLAKDAVTKAVLMELLEQPAAEKAKEAEDLTCRACYGKYTDARDSGGGSKNNYGFCSKTCRAAKGKCDHGRKKSQCKDCGTGYCDHGRRKAKCKDCGTGYCNHGRKKSQCKDCGTGYCEHGHQRGQ